VVFAWAFVLTEGALALLAALNAMFGLPRLGALFWGLFGRRLAAFTAALLGASRRPGSSASPTDERARGREPGRGRSAPTLR